MIGDRILYLAVPACESISCFLWNRHFYLAAIIVVLYNITFSVIQSEFNRISVSGVIKRVYVLSLIRPDLYRFQLRRRKAFCECSIFNSFRRYKRIDLCFFVYDLVIYISAVQILDPVDQCIGTHIRDPFHIQGQISVRHNTAERLCISRILVPAPKQISLSCLCR